MPLEDLAPLGRWTYYSGTAGTVTLVTGQALLSIWAIGGAGAGSLTITPAGANQTGVAGTAIVIPIGALFGPFNFAGQLGAGTVLVFAATASYFVQVHTILSGAAAKLTTGF